MATTGYEDANSIESKMKKERESYEKKLKQIQKTLKNKNLTDKQRKKYKASKKKIQGFLAKIKQVQSILPKKYSGTQNIVAKRGTTKIVKIPADNLFKVAREGVPAESMEKLFFDSIGTTEIINVERHDNINTINAPYQPIADIASINTEYNVNKIVSLQKIASLYFNTFGISFETYEPENGTGPNNEIVYVESETGDLVINVLDLPDNFRVEVQVMSFEDILNDTIYI